MDDVLKAKWTGALRSGSYKQGIGRLRSTDNEYCCLGVLCDLLDEVEWELDDIGGWLAVDTTVDVNTPGRRNNGTLPSSIRDRYLGYEWEQALVAMNDNRIPFDNIADAIDEWT